MNARVGSGAVFAGFEALWSAIPYPALVVDGEERILSVNPAAESFGGTSLRQMAGKPLGRFVGLGLCLPIAGGE